MRKPLTFVSAWLTCAMLVAVPMTAMAQGNPSALPAQTSSDRGVSITVTPKSLGARNGRWEFSIVLDTHSADLGDDLTQSVSLTTSDGRTFKPVSWTGSAPGGHHRQGVLAFDIPVPRPAALELKIVRPGESSARAFRWKL